MAKFDNAKRGTPVWDLLLQEWGKIELIEDEKVYAIFDKGGIHLYNLDGTFGDVKTPVLYYTEKRIDITDIIPRTTFDLVEFLKDNLKPTDFKYGDENIYLYYNCEEEYIDWDSNEVDEIMGTIYFEEIEDNRLNTIVNEMNDRGVTPEQLKEAYKELSWL